MLHVPKIGEHYRSKNGKIDGIIFDIQDAWIILTDLKDGGYIGFRWTGFFYQNPKRVIDGVVQDHEEYEQIPEIIVKENGK